MTQALPETTMVEQVTLKVADLKRMEDFYTQVIGLMILKEEADTAFLAAQGSTNTILVLKKITPEESAVETTGLYHTAFLLPTRKDLANTLLWLMQKDVELGAADHGYSEALYLTDPEGNGIEIYHDKPMIVWDIRPNGEIIGVTEELDADGLVKTSDGQWLGLAPGSKIGHIHLKVADLERTQEFYTALGFSLKSNFGTKAKFFAAGPYHHHIGTNTWSGAGLPKVQANQLGLESYMFRLPDKAGLELVKANAEAAGLDFTSEPHQLTLEDPSGMLLTFMHE